MVDRSPKKRAAGAWVAGLCLAALLVGDLFRGAHLLSAPHVVCPEHGELVHAGDLGLPRASSPSAGHAEALPGGSADHHHEHCDAAAAQHRSSDAVIVSASLDAHVAFVASILPLSGAPSVSALAVLSYAPKQSPPV